MQKAVNINIFAQAFKEQDNQINHALSIKIIKNINNLIYERVNIQLFISISRQVKEDDYAKINF
tara:strand:- start:234 stop:425 length:192 start_codon:yes stop_codon:yes gene_type:complete